MIFEIYSSDGDVHMRIFKDDAEYLKAVNKEFEDCDPPEFIKLGKASILDLTAVGGTLVIRGEIVQLKAKETVRTWTLGG